MRSNNFGWHSKTNLSGRDEFSQITKIIHDALNKISTDEEYSSETNLVIENMWAIVSPKYAYNSQHFHPHSLWSGVYYIKVPKNSGKLFLEDPRPGPNTYMPRRVEDLPKQLWRVIAHEPIEGRMIFFPSWLPHGVDINMNTDKGEKNWRVSVSYNFIQV